MKAGIFARYSDRDRQSESSIDQQLRLLNDRAEKEGWQVVSTITDKGMSGATRFRPGWHQLIHAIQNREFDILLTESLDRLSRDMEDIAYLFKRCRHYGIRIVTLLEGDEISEIHIGMKGTMSAIYLKDLGRRAHRGLEQRAIQGESTGGRSYGYKIEPRYDAKGNRIGGIISVDEGQAPHVVRIFEDYADKGKSPKKIAAELNREGIPGPRGGTWSASTIYGNRRRMTGLLLNQAYIGRKVWAKQSFFKDPDTGRGNGRLNDESKWIYADVPEQRIIDDELWERAQARMKELAARGDYGQQRRPQKLFSFLLKCGECGGGFAKLSQTH